MSRSRELQLHIHQLEEIRSILNAMKNLALMAVHKLTRLQQLQSQVVAHIEDNAAAFLAAHPQFRDGDAPDKPVYIVVGSERGFCGDFNERLLDSLQGLPNGGVLLVGSRLIGKADNDAYPLLASLTGANIAEEVLSLLEELMERLNRLDGNPPLIAVYHDLQTNQLKHRQLLPLALPEQRNDNPPLLHLPAEAFFEQLLEQYLWAALHEVIFLSLFAENKLRLQHLEGAVQHLDKQTQTLHRKSQIFRQEEITEEIEVILLNTGA